jgi:hypothetical protein
MLSIGITLLFYPLISSRIKVLSILEDTEPSINTEFSNSKYSSRALSPETVINMNMLDATFQVLPVTIGISILSKKIM